MSRKNRNHVEQDDEEIEILEVEDSVEDIEEIQVPQPKGRYFTYIGAGADSPYVITLMGKQKFVRGELTLVTDTELLMKLPGMATFFEGKVDQEVLHKIDQEGKAAFERRRAEDQILNAKYTKKHLGE
jgi:hypothetical protein